MGKWAGLDWSSSEGGAAAAAAAAAAARTCSRVGCREGAGGRIDGFVR